MEQGLSPALLYHELRAENMSTWAALDYPGLMQAEGRTQKARLDPATRQSAGRQIALVLGDSGIGGLISENLWNLGYETELRPAPSLSSDTDALRSLVAEFARPHAGSNAQLWIHPGVTPIAERNEWPIIARESGVTFIGPPARSLSLFNNRLTLLNEAENIGISNLVLSHDPLHSAREIEKLIRSNRLKLPFVLKAVRGGSGFGVRVVHQPEDLGNTLTLWLEQIRRSLGDVIILAERYLEGARRIVQPFARFLDGSMELFPPVDASLTCRLRKVIEFCPAEAGELKTIRDWTQALAARAGYVGVGSLEYLVDGTRSYLIEGVPRLNTSFKVWESVAGTSAVAWQLAAQSGAGSQRPEKFPGWKASIALRIQAEDPILQLPQPGKVIDTAEKSEWEFPGSQARLDLAVRAGEELRPSDPGTAAYLWIEAEDRKRAITVARGVLDEIWIAGSLQTNERFLQELLTHPWVQEGMFHASFVDEEFIPSVRPDSELLQAFVAMAKLLTPERPPAASQEKWAVGDQWIRGDAPLVFSWVVEPAYVKASVEGDGKRAISGVLKTSKGQTLRAFCYPVAENRWTGRVGNWFLPIRRVVAEPKGKSAQAPLGPRLSALVSGRVHSLFFREGVWVPAHETVLLIESLNTLVPHALPSDLRLVRWLVGPEDHVEAGMPLAEFERAPSLR